MLTSIRVFQLEEDANTLNLEKLAVEQENRSVRDSNFELQSKARAADTISKRMQSEVVDKDQQIRIMTDQNSELVRLLESEEVASAHLQSEVSELRAELDRWWQALDDLAARLAPARAAAFSAALDGLFLRSCTGTGPGDIGEVLGQFG